MLHKNVNREDSKSIYSPAAIREQIKIGVINGIMTFIPIFLTGLSEKKETSENHGFTLFSGSFIKTDTRLLLARRLFDPLYDKAMGSVEGHFFLQMCIVSPILEEIIHRGIIKNGIKSSLKILKKVCNKTKHQEFDNMIAAVISSADFALSHVEDVKLDKIFGEQDLYAPGQATLISSIASHLTHNMICYMLLKAERSTHPNYSLYCVGGFVALNASLAAYYFYNNYKSGTLLDVKDSEEKPVVSNEKRLVPRPMRNRLFSSTYEGAKKGVKYGTLTAFVTAFPTIISYVRWSHPSAVLRLMIFVGVHGALCGGFLGALMGGMNVSGNNHHFPLIGTDMTSTTNNNETRAKNRRP